MPTQASWSRWYYGITHLDIDRGGSSGAGRDVATINRFSDGTCTLWLYNTHDEHLFTDESRTTYHKSVEEAMKIAERRYGVKAQRPVAARPADHPCNPRF